MERDGSVTSLPIWQSGNPDIKDLVEMLLLFCTEFLEGPCSFNFDVGHLFMELHLFLAEFRQSNMHDDEAKKKKKRWIKFATKKIPPACLQHKQHKLQEIFVTLRWGLLFSSGCCPRHCLDQNALN